MPDRAAPRRAILLSLAVSVVLPAALAAQESTLPVDGKQLVVHDVRDLVGRAAERDAAAAEDATLVPGDEPADPARRSGVDALASYVRRFAEPPLEAGGDLETFAQGMLVCLASSDTQAWIRRFLAEQRRRGEHLFDVQVRLLRIEATAFEEHVEPLLNDGSEVAAADAPAAPRAATVGAPSAVLEPGDRTQAFLEALAPATVAGIETITAPRLLALPWQRLSVSVSKQISYVRDYEVETVQGAVIADPIIDVLDTGLFLDAQVAVLPGGDLGLDLRCRHTELVSMPKHEADLAAADERLPKPTMVWIQLPRIVTSQLTTRAVLPAGGAIVLALPPKATAADARAPEVAADAGAGIGERDAADAKAAPRAGGHREVLVIEARIVQPR